MAWFWTLLGSLRAGESPVLEWKEQREQSPLVVEEALHCVAAMGGVVLPLVSLWQLAVRRCEVGLLARDLPPW